MIYTMTGHVVQQRLSIIVGIRVINIYLQEEKKCQK